MTLIIIAGNDGAGKSHLAKTLCQDFHWPNAISPFGDCPRHEVAARYGLPLAKVYQKPTPPEVRKLLIDWGLEKEAELGYKEARQYVIDFWVNRHGHKPVAVIDDARFVEESNWGRRLGGLVIFIDHPPTAQQLRNPGTYYHRLEEVKALAHIHTTFHDIRTMAEYERIRETLEQLVCHSDWKNTNNS